MLKKQADSTMDFYLVRHADARSELEDPRRPLSPRGRRDVEKIGRALLARDAVPFEILHSDKLRARETAEILGRILNPRGGMREIQGLGPQDDPFSIQAELALSERSLMLVGHLPHLSHLLSLLVSNDPERTTMDFPPAGVACLAREENQWKITWILEPNSL